MIAGFETPYGGRDPDRRRGHHPAASQSAQRRDGVPVLRAVPEHDGRRQRGLRPEGGQAAERGDRPRVQEMLELIKLPALGKPLSRTSSRAGSSSAWRWRAPWPSSRRCCCSTSPCRRWTPRSASSLRNEIRAIQRKLGITTIYVTHDQEEALSLSDRIVVMRDGRVEQIGTPFEIYNFPRTSFVASFVGTLSILRGAGGGPGPRRDRDRRAGDPGRAGPRGRAGRRGALGGAPARDRVPPRAAGQREPDAGHRGGRQLPGSIVRIRVRFGDNAVSLDTFNNPRRGAAPARAGGDGDLSPGGGPGAGGHPRPAEGRPPGLASRGPGGRPRYGPSSTIRR